MTDFPALGETFTRATVFTGFGVPSCAAVRRSHHVVLLRGEGYGPVHIVEGAEKTLFELGLAADTVLLNQVEYEGPGRGILASGSLRFHILLQLFRQRDVQGGRHISIGRHFGTRGTRGIAEAQNSGALILWLG